MERLGPSLSGYLGPPASALSHRSFFGWEGSGPYSNRPQKKRKKEEEKKTVPLFLSSLLEDLAIYEWVSQAPRICIVFFLQALAGKPLRSCFFSMLQRVRQVNA